MPENIRLAFRLDDPSSHSNHALEEKIIEALAQNGARATFAVIPFSERSGEKKCLEAAEVPHLLRGQEQGTLEIALHGHLHSAWKRLEDGNQSEFATRPRDQQLQLLREGRACLERSFGPITGFVPPWNSFDGATLKALSDLGFRYLSGGWEYTPDGMATLPVLPHTCNLAYLEQAMSEARELRHLSPVIVTIMHHYDFHESGSSEAVTDLSELNRLLASVAGRADIELTTLDELAATVPAGHAAANMHYHHWRERRHWRVNRLLPGFVLLNASAARLAGGLGLHALRRLPRAVRG